MTLASSSVDSSPPFFAPDLEGLAQAPAPVARAILVALCDDRRVRAQALRQLGRLLRFEADVRGRDPVVGSPDSPATSPSNPRKRKATGEPKICVQCDCIFTDNENTFGACWYHTGEQKPMKTMTTAMISATSKPTHPLPFFCHCSPKKIRLSGGTEY